jgi:hypothetical protein
VSAGEGNRERVGKEVRSEKVEEDARRERVREVATRERESTDEALRAAMGAAAREMEVVIATHLLGRLRRL